MRFIVPFKNICEVKRGALIKYMNNDYGKQEVQEKILEIACEIKNLCEKHNIEYYISDGSCLGAVRHGGFIPWDDDFDMMMTYDNYKKFAEIAKRELSEPFFYQDTETDPNYRSVFAKVRNSDTTFIEDALSHIKMNHGIYVDIFILSGVPDNFILKNIQRFAGFMWFFLQEFIAPRKNKLKKAICSAVFSVIDFFHIRKPLIELFKSIYLHYKPENCRTWTYSMGKFNYNQTTMDSSIIGKPIDIDFEGIRFSTVEFPEQYCKHLYGDYMTPPPEDNRSDKVHAERFDTNKSYREYMNV